LRDSRSVPVVGLRAPSAAGSAIILGSNPIPTDHLQLVAMLVRLARLSREPHAQRPQLEDDIRIVRLARPSRFEKYFVDAELVKSLLRLLRETPAVGFAVVQDRQPPSAETLDQEVTRDPALHVITPDDAEHAREACAVSLALVAKLEIMRIPASA
jgi:hypothetical protein